MNLERRKKEYGIDLEYVEDRFSDELQGTEITITEREIGNGPQFALEVRRVDEPSVPLWESQWYSPKEFTAFLEGMKTLERLFREAEKQRSDE